MKFKYVNFDGGETISLVFLTGDAMPVTISPVHEAWDQFKTALLNDPDSMSEDDARSLLIKYDKAAKWIGSVTDSVSVTMYGVKIDGEILEGKVADVLTQMAKDGGEGNEAYAKALARFIEKANSNPSIENADVLYKWIINEGLTITPDGDFIGYKGVAHHDIENPNEYVFPEEVSVRSSTVDGGGIVNGVDFPKYVPNFVGAVVGMPRDKVDANGNNECSVGLHVGTYGYASGFTNHVMLVKVNPANVVAVSKDYSFQKIRCCEYLVILDKVESQLDERLYINEEFAPVSSEPLSMTEEVALKTVIERLRKATSKV